MLRRIGFFRGKQPRKERAGPIALRSSRPCRTRLLVDTEADLADQSIGHEPRRGWGRHRTGGRRVGNGTILAQSDTIFPGIAGAATHHWQSAVHADSLQTVYPLTCGLDT